MMKELVPVLCPLCHKPVCHASEDGTRVKYECGTDLEWDGDGWDPNPSGDCVYAYYNYMRRN